MEQLAAAGVRGDGQHFERAAVDSTAHQQGPCRHRRHSQSAQ